jgi:hypothetical protein
MKRFFVGVLKRNSMGTSYLIRMDGNDPVRISRLNIKTKIQSGSRVVVEGRQNLHTLEVDRLITWPYPKRDSRIKHTMSINKAYDLPTAS